MPDNAQEYSKEPMDAFNELIGKSFAAFQVGSEQTTAAAKLFAPTAEIEREEAGNAWKQVADYASGRNETVAAALTDFCTSDPKPESKEFLGKLFDQDRTFYQTWSDYIAGIQQRLGSFSKDSIEATAKNVESSQSLAQSAVRYGEAVQAWSQKAVEAVTPKTSS